MDLEIKLPDESRTMSFNIELGKDYFLLLFNILITPRPTVTFRYSIVLL
jgi:hypothetical protein